MKKLGSGIIVALVMCLLVSPAWSAVLVVAPDGKKVVKATLLKASTDADTAGKTIIVTTPQTIDNITIPSDVTLKLEGKGSVSVNVNKVLQINGTFRAPKKDVFNGAGKVYFGPKTGVVYPEWWKDNATPGTTDMTDAIQAAIDCWNDANNGGTIEFDDTTYAATKIALASARRYVGKKAIWKSLASAETGFVVLGKQPCLDIVMDGIQLLGNAANVFQHGLSIVASNNNGVGTGGLWYSNFSNMQITGFTGYGMNFDAQDGLGDGTDVANQFLVFNNIRVWSNGTATSRALYVIGQFGQAVFNMCEFDGINHAVGTLNVEFVKTEVVSPSNSDETYSVDFNSCTFQTAETALKGYYVHNMNLDKCHFEGLATALLFTANSTATVNGCSFGSSADGGGTGYLLKAAAGATVAFTNNNYSGVTDRIVVGDNANNVYSFGNVAKAPASSVADFIAGNPVFSAGLTKALGVAADGSLLLNGTKVALVAGGGNTLKNIYSTQGEGEVIVIRAFSGPLVMNNTGNIDIPASIGFSLTLEDGDTAIFIKNDLTLPWLMVGVARGLKSELLTNLSTYADNAAALAGGLVAGKAYRTATGVMMVVY